MMHRQAGMPIIGLILVLIVCGCQTLATGVTEEQKKAMRQKIDDWSRERDLDQSAKVTSIGYRLMQVGSNETSEKPVSVLPFLYLENFPREYQGERKNEGLMIARKLPAMGVEGHDIQKFDVLRKVGETAVKNEEELLKALQTQSGETVQVTFLRDAKEFVLKVPVFKLKEKYQFVMTDEDQPNAYVNLEHHKVHVTRQLLKFVRNDDELAFVLAHEIGHIELHHIAKTVVGNLAASAAGSVVGSLVNRYAPGAGGVAGSLTSKTLQAPYSQEMEKAADQAAITKIMASGFDIMKAEKVWERFAFELPQSQEGSFLKTHPSSPERLFKIRQTIEAAQPPAIALPEVPAAEKP